MTDKTTSANSAVMADQTQPELSLPADRMPEAEVALRLAAFILTLSGSGSTASVAIDRASIKVGDAGVLDIGRFMPGMGWEPMAGRTAWSGAYQRGNKTIRVHSRRGEGGVVAQVNGRRLVAKCTKGPLVRKVSTPECALLTTALGQALLFDVSADDIAVAAVPDTPVFRRLAGAWRERPLIRRAGIRIAVVARDGAVSGLNL
jgi:hypothetical protein